MAFCLAALTWNGFNGEATDQISYQLKVKDLFTQYEVCRDRGGAGCRGVLQEHESILACLGKEPTSEQDSVRLTVLDGHRREVAPPSQFLLIDDTHLTALSNSTLRTWLNNRRYNDVPAQLQLWVNAGGQVNNGLVNRRAAEIDIWRNANYTSP